VVVDRGDPTARLVFIGEAPGANEDAQGEAFVGRAGALLDELLAEAGVEKFLILNVLKCRPPNNKFPGDGDAHHSVDIVDKCTPWLDKQLEIVRPKAIILVGGKAAGYTIYRGRKMPAVKDIAGKWMRSSSYPRIELFGMYHTSYMLRLRNYDRSEYDRVRENTLEILRSAQLVVDGELPSGSPMGVSGPREDGEQLSFF
jgi:DNA polymerase